MEGGHQPRARICSRTSTWGRFYAANKYAGPGEDRENGERERERTSRSMPVLAPGFVSRLQPPINTTHSASNRPPASRFCRTISTAAHPYPRIDAIVESLRGGAEKLHRGWDEGWNGPLKMWKRRSFCSSKRKKLCQKPLENTIHRLSR